MEAQEICPTKFKTLKENIKQHKNTFTEQDDIKKKSKQYTEELYKKHKRITDSFQEEESMILKSEARAALSNRNKSTGVDEVSVEQQSPSKS